MENSLHKKLSIYLDKRTIHYPGYVSINLTELNTIEDYSVENLHCNCLEYVDNPILLLNDLCKKVCGGGQIIIEGYEIYLIARNITVGIIDMISVNNMLYNGKISSISMIQVYQFLEDNDFIVTDRDIDNQKFMVIAKKNV